MREHVLKNTISIFFSFSSDLANFILSVFCRFFSGFRKILLVVWKILQVAESELKLEKFSREIL